jgi:proline iminopeptidase
MRRAALRHVVRVAVLLALPAGCNPISPEAPGALVPPTADQDPALPQLRVTVAGHTRALHLEAFGDPALPPLLVLPGGPGADFRLMLPLRALADRYRVVMWDPRGAGLSERVTSSELTVESGLEEIAAVQAAVAPGRRATLVGHSFGGALMAAYTARHPERVEQLVLIEPRALVVPAPTDYEGGWVSGGAAEDFLWQNELLTSSDHAAADHKAVSVLPASSASFTCDGRPPAPYPMWRFGAFHHHVLTHTSHAPGPDFAWTAGIERFAPEVLVVAGTCGALRAEVQRRHTTPALPRARLVEVPGAGHISLFTDHADELLAVLRGYLAAYGEAEP